MNDLCVVVNEKHEIDGELRLSRFHSRVYAIEGNKFLVYDEGSQYSSYGFKWVDITETYFNSEIGAEVPCVDILDQDEKETYIIY